jgi:transposase
MCREAGVRLIYLSPYFPDFNPIEFSFSPLKAWMRSYKELTEQFTGWYKGFSHLAVQLCGVEKHAKGLFRKCYFRVDENTFDVPYHTLEAL